MNENNLTDNLVKGFEKLINTDIIKKDYPMIDHFNLHWGLNTYRKIILMYEIYLNDSSINEDNLYEKGLDPHYLVDINMPRYMRFFGLEPIVYGQGFIVYDTDLNVIDKWNVV